MENKLTLKRGYGRVFVGENWNLVGEGQWYHHRLLVPNGGEPYFGNRKIGGVEHAVFRCFNDDFFAQPLSVCEMPVPEDPMEVLCEAPEDVSYELPPYRDHSPPEREAPPEPARRPKRVEKQNWVEKLVAKKRETEEKPVEPKKLPPVPDESHLFVHAAPATMMGLEQMDD